MSPTIRPRLVILLLAAASSGCFATRDDVRILQADIASLRADRARADSAHAAQLARVIETLALVSDSVAVYDARLTKMQGDVRGDLYSMGQQLIAVQELTGQSQRRLQELRGDLEKHYQAPPAPPPVGVAALPDSTARVDSSAAAAVATAPAAPAAPGPNELFQAALAQLRRGSYATARSAFEQLLGMYPAADVAADAQFYIGEAYRAEGNAPAADSAYQKVVTGYPQSPRVPTALYKRAQWMETQGNATAARALYNEIVQKYPRSDEAALAHERLRAIP